MLPEINNYIEKRYYRWLDYARFKCDKAGIKDKECEVLSEVVYSLLKRDEHFLLNLFEAKKMHKGVQYTELDFFVLRAIEVNVNSETSPYRYQNRLIPRGKIELFKLKITDEQEEQVDHAGYVLERMHQIRELINQMGFSEKAMAIFEYCFFEDGSIKDWPGTETPKQIYSIYKRIKDILKRKINGEIIF